jgi:large subunit ribosomal protein L21
LAYAIIKVGGKQHRVREGEWLLVDRLPHDEGATFEPDVLLLGGEGEALLGPDELKGTVVTARVAEHLLGQKIVIGKHKRRTGYRRRNGFRARLSKIEIESIGAKPARPSRAKKAAAPAEEVPAPAEEAPAPAEVAATPEAEAPKATRRRSTKAPEAE